MRVHTIIGSISLALVVCQAPLWAHHAFAAEFDANKPLRFDDATVTKVQLINPHSWINVDVKFPDGRVENWAIEAGSPAGQGPPTGLARRSSWWRGRAQVCGRMRGTISITRFRCFKSACVPIAAAFAAHLLYLRLFSLCSPAVDF